MRSLYIMKELMTVLGGILSFLLGWLFSKELRRRSKENDKILMPRL